MAGVTFGLIAAPCVLPQFVKVRWDNDADWKDINDKWAHCVAACRASKWCGMVFAITGSVFKEFLDCLGFGPAIPGHANFG
jgi:membrane associated rhomboid family serine protease